MSSGLFRASPPRPLPGDGSPPLPDDGGEPTNRFLALPPAADDGGEPTERLPTVALVPTGPPRWGLASAVALAVAAGFVVGRATDDLAGPLVVGTFEGGTLCGRPVAAAGPVDGFQPRKGGRVEVYGRFVVVEDPATGVRHVRPLEHVSGLSVK